MVHFQRWRIINAGGSHFVELNIEECELFILAFDGIYLQQPWLVPFVVLPIGSRVDIAIRCNNSGIFSFKSTVFQKNDPYLGLQTERWSGNVLYVEVSNQTNEMKLPSNLPILPKYLQQNLFDLSLRVDGEFVSEFQRPGSNFWINNQSFEGHSIEGCQTTVQSFSLQQWHIRNSASNNHPFHMHNLHFQIVGYNGKVNKEEQFISEALSMRIGMWRDTIPVLGNTINSSSVEVLIRFIPIIKESQARIMFHCHLPAHSDLGMAAIFLVINNETTNSNNSFSSNEQTTTSLAFSFSSFSNEKFRILCLCNLFFVHFFSI